VISVIRELPRPSKSEVLPLVKTFFGKLRYGPVSTSLPYTSVATDLSDVQLVDSEQPSRIARRLFLLVVPIKTVDQVVELEFGLNDQSRRLHV
jgi:hypothetical protein